jgi:hypothetical protein
VTVEFLSLSAVTLNSSLRPVPLIVALPRLTVQVTHEWATPKNRTLKQIVSTEKGKALEGLANNIYNFIKINGDDTLFQVAPWASIKTPSWR